MALVNASPVEGAPVLAHVRWDRAAGRPSVIRWADHRVRVVQLDAVRDERAAFPAGRGPALHLTLRTDDGGRATICFDPARRRWYMEAIEPAA